MAYQLDPKVAQLAAEKESLRYGGKLMLMKDVAKEVIFQGVAVEIRDNHGRQEEMFVYKFIDPRSMKDVEYCSTSTNLLDKIVNDLKADAGDLLQITKTGRRGRDYYEVALLARSEENLANSIEEAKPLYNPTNNPPKKARSSDMVDLDDDFATLD